MKQELLLKDLCARLPYGVKVSNDGYIAVLSPIMIATIMLKNDVDIKPYLRPMSSMTAEELKELNVIFDNCDTEYRVEAQDWLNAHHFDYRGLIEKGLAIEAPEGMYKTE